MIKIIDYGVGNINAFLNVYKKLSISVEHATCAADISDATKLILPGVGSFDHAMIKFQDSGMKEVVEEKVLQSKVPVLGICVGMQMLAKSSTEGVLPGLGWINGEVKRFDAEKIPFPTKFPHMGWNEVITVKPNSLFKDMQKESEFYFLHSYYFECASPDDVLATADYGIQFAAAVQRENVYGIQCHPEKSHQYGVQLLKNFAML